MKSLMILAGFHRREFDIFSAHIALGMKAYVLWFYNVGENNRLSLRCSTWTHVKNAAMVMLLTVASLLCIYTTANELCGLILNKRSESVFKTKQKNHICWCKLLLVVIDIIITETGEEKFAEGIAYIYILKFCSIQSTFSFSWSVLTWFYRHFHEVIMRWDQFWIWVVTIYQHLR